MLTFKNRNIAALLAAVVVGTSVSVLATEPVYSGTKSGTVVVVASGPKVSAAALPAHNDAVVPAVATAVEAVEDLPKSKRPHAWFLSGVEAYNAGDGRLAVERWTKAADRGHLVAQWNLARLYRSGDLIDADPIKALTYFRIVAEQTDPNRIRDQRNAIAVAAFVELADIYRAGEPLADIAPDAKRAFEMYKLAATLYGNARAQHRMGTMYLTGEGVRQHFGRAVRWLALAASKRYTPSFAALGEFFWQNRETATNRVQGLMWLSLARDNTERDDLRAVFSDRYEAAMIEANDEERQRAIALVQNWNQSHNATQ